MGPSGNPGSTAWHRQTRALGRAGPPVPQPPPRLLPKHCAWLDPPIPKVSPAMLLAENYNNTKTKNKTFPENLLRLRAGLGLGAGTAAEASSPGASLCHVGTLPLFVLPVNKAKQSIKRHLETSETHSFHVTYFKKR